LLFQDMNIDDVVKLTKDIGVVTIDVRSPSEFADATIPGSVNIPFFDDAERAEIGTIYKQDSVKAAMDRGLEIFSAKLPAFIKQFEQIQGPKAVFCWRGGMRSKTSATVLSLMGIKVHRLTGGFRAYRRWVVETLEGIDFKPRHVVLLGNTGTGKTEILRQLKQEGFPVLDLEGMAGHRGSVFGHVGMKAHNQKTFDSLLVTELLQWQRSPYVLLEGESKRIGKVVLPEVIMDKRGQAAQLFIQLPLEERVRHIVADYQPSEHKQALMEGFKHIKGRIHTPIAKEIMASLESEQYEQAVKLLLEHYYDPRYEHAMQQYGTDITLIQANTIADAVQDVKDYIARQFK